MGQLRHLSESVLYAFVHQILEGGAATEASAHLEQCLACRVWVIRLRQTTVVEPDHPVISRLVAASPAVPEALRRALAAEPTEAAPVEGELWRVGRDEALLVWVRRVFDDTAAVLPVTFDDDLADEFSLIVADDESPLGLQLVVMASIEAEVDLRAFLQPVGALPVQEHVTALRKSRRTGYSTPAGLLVGAPIVDEQDQRIEYRQVLSDLLADLSLDAFATETKVQPLEGGEARGDADCTVIMSRSPSVEKTAEPLGRATGLIAFEIDRYNRVTRVDPVTEFNLPAASLTILSSCRRPRPEHYATDLAAIAERSGVKISTVANLLRATDAVTALASRREISFTNRMDNRGLLAAARDHGEEYTAFEEPDRQAQTLPGWLIRAVDRFWGEAVADSTFPRDLALPILTNLPLAIVEIDGLTVEKLNRWLHQRNLPQLTSVADRPLRGCLVAYGGVGLLFADRSDDVEQRRLTMAHEAAHFVVDYLIPRENVARRRPSLLDVLDGQREPTDSERFDALLADIPVGLHTHLLERDAHGGHLSMSMADIEDRAERLALELLAPLQRALNETVTVDERNIQRLLQERFGLPAGIAARYANHLRRFRHGPPRTLLEAIGLTPAEGEDAYTEDAHHREADS